MWGGTFVALGQPRILVIRLTASPPTQICRLLPPPPTNRYIGLPPSPAPHRSVPFRLTRNLSTFFNAFGVEGTFAPAVINCAAAMLAKWVVVVLWTDYRGGVCGRSVHSLG